MFSKQLKVRRTIMVGILVLCWSGGANQVETQDTQHLLITEVSLHHPEFVEIYNPTDLAMRLSELWFCYYPANRDSWEVPWRFRQFPAEAIIAANGYFLLTFGEDETGQDLPADWLVYSGKTLNADAGAIAILNDAPGKGEVVDAVGWGDSHLAVGNVAATAPEGSALARLPGTSRDESFHNSGDNATDFQHALPSPSSSRAGIVIVSDGSQIMNPMTNKYEFSLFNAGPVARSFTIDTESEIGYTAIPQQTTLSLAPGEWGTIELLRQPYDYYVIDLETTGFSPNENSIIEAAWVYVCDGEVLQTDSSLVFLDRELNPVIVELTGITAKMLIAAPKLELVIPSLFSVLEGEVVLSYSGTSFDRRFLEAAATSLELDMPDIQWINVFSWIKKATPDLPDHSLQTVAESLGVEGLHHRALPDSLLTNLVFQEAVRRLGSHLYVTIRAEGSKLPAGVLVLQLAPF